ncbi:MAG: hypothetical protein JWM19_918 [Actinomycetia bacterium]|nr:hypothetical protein [Actinomycetes bacterium]
MRHQWDYEGGSKEGSRHRSCKRCRARQRTFSTGYWSLPSALEWQPHDRRTWSPGRGPECHDPSKRPAETEWSRVEDSHPRWVISNPKGDGADYLCTDKVIRTYGRKHTEHLLRGLPPLPEKAWEVLGG